ncbi:ribosomal protein S18-alanine N-acetyltransferase [Tepidimonas taiwanensis]|uniref:[Ribosomal protein bS18]-alanine N-acetyltransferase n=1 Tax=Tepidimonas taiwanensis TaxID=307486 RepID=A0A554X414_9BURK|nr:ribosomal protein S18-alanine N-acetyltransferase [Tepidimonas taiwanensis]MCX7693317.1 ribosomal protein S18-alanine N-acetyltransferase [Tepidimonas taiwanensis]MDM7463521.1 ribosomal protein S18-alanine N-acetyltransferase [Tepidimonas taiwanensis]TSE30582.1 Ribosomal-protein-alanine acetyltransferase [Tepidimonas taiwanensis]UBQ05173.1 ribosomal protein S18-alanine N-acetyltransferase [Tepidimonas taiwanensis]
MLDALDAPTAPPPRAPADAARLVWRAMTPADIPLVAEVAKTAHAHPWKARHFEDSLVAGYWCRMLTLRPDPASDPRHWVHAPRTAEGHWLLGYLVAMPGVDEAHLLDITVAPAHRRAGWGRWMLRALRDWAAQQGAACLWLEVRASNTAARTLYASEGWQTVGVRRGYYPDTDQRREDAIVMRRDLPLVATEANGR